MTFTDSVPFFFGEVYTGTRCLNSWALWTFIINTYKKLQLYALCLLMIILWHKKKRLSPSPNNMNARCLSSKPGPFLAGIFPIYERVYFLSSSSLLFLPLSPTLSVSLIYVLTCGHSLIIPILISATVNEWRDSSGRVWTFGLMWALQWGSLGIARAHTVHYCGYMTF